jgi:hypothetical protein
MLSGSGFDRIMQTNALCQKGYGEKMLVPTSLEDNTSKMFRKYNVILPTNFIIVTSWLVSLEAS